MSAAVDESDSSRTSWRRPFHGSLGQRITPFVFLLLPVGLLLTFTYIPVANMFWYSLIEWDGYSVDREFVGPANYVEFFTRPELYQVFWVSVYYFVGAFVQMALALFFATVLSFKVRFSNFFKGTLFFPYLINGVAIGFVFLYFFRPGGTLDSLLAILGLEDWSRLWLGDRSLVNYSLAGTSVWRFMGLNFVLFLGAIQSIPSELYEASEIDGANRWAQFRYIILPGISSVLTLSTILAISGALAVFEIPFVMTRGANGSMTFVIQTVDLAFKFGKVGLASAMAVVLLLIVLFVTWLQRKFVPEERVDLV